VAWNQRPGRAAVGIDQISTVGLRLLFQEPARHLQIASSELTRSVRWDCDSDILASSAAISTSSELTRSVRWDCDRWDRCRRPEPRRPSPSELTRSVRWDCDRHRDKRRPCGTARVGIDQISTVGLRHRRRVVVDDVGVLVGIDQISTVGLRRRRPRQGASRRADVGIDQISTVGLRRSAGESASKEARLTSELTRSVRWDCDDVLLGGRDTSLAWRLGRN
jgi:hypothetical protein